MRKFLLFSILLVCFATLTNAQVISKGQKIIGGSIGFSTVKDESQISFDYKQTNLVLAPSYAKAIKDNLLIGASISFSKNNAHQDFNNSPNIYRTNNTSTGAELFLEKFYPLVNNFSIATKAGLNGGRFNGEHESMYGTENYITDSKGFYTGISLEPSLNFIFSKRLLAQFYFNDLVAFRYENGKKTEINMAGKQTKNYDDLSFTSSLNREKSLSDFTLSFRYLLK